MESACIYNTCNQRNMIGVRYCVNCGASRNNTIQESFAYEAFEGSDGDMVYVSEDESEMEEIPLLETMRERNERRRNTVSSQEQMGSLRRQRFLRNVLDYFEFLMRNVELIQQEIDTYETNENPNSVSATTLSHG